MSNPIGNTRNLDASRTDAIQGLLGSLRHTNDDPSSDGMLSTEQLQKLSEKINEILGDGTDHGLMPEDQSSQLLDEDGLPIIDISEQVNEISQTSTSLSPIIEQDLISFSVLPHDERERRRRERDRILDMLEEEERLQRIQEENDAEEERKEAIRKRKESTKVELDQLKVARELQKKMGQALVRHAKGTGENGRENTRLKPQMTPLVARKSVSFADTPAVEADELGQQTSVHEPDWTDVTPGRLRAQSRIPLMSAAEAQKYPMKMRVVERHPTATTISSFHNDADSDDESAASAGQHSPHTENDFSDEEARSSSSNSGLSDDEPLEEGFDYDIAQRHREIAIEYHKRRHAIGAEAAKAMAAHTIDDHEQVESHQSNGQLPLSRFRADRMAAAYDKSHGPISTSIGQNVIPASRQKSLRNSVRLGKLENDQLVGGNSGESGSEDETIREVIQMLQTGSIQNAGPDFRPSSMSTMTPRNSCAVESPSVGTPTTQGAKPSRSKLARGGITETTTFHDDTHEENARSQPAISNVVERKDPRPLLAQHFPTNKPLPRSSVEISEPAPPTIINSRSSSPSPAYPMTIGSSPHQTQLERSPLVRSSVTQDSMVQSRVPSRDLPSVERPISKFMTERKKIIH